VKFFSAVQIGIRVVYINALTGLYNHLLVGGNIQVTFWDNWITNAALLYFIVKWLIQKYTSLVPRFSHAQTKNEEHHKVRRKNLTACGKLQGMYNYRPVW